MVKLTSLTIKGVEFSLALEQEENGSSVLVARNGDEVYKFSPNTTDEELTKQVTELDIIQ